MKLTHRIDTSAQRAEAEARIDRQFDLRSIYPMKVDLARRACAGEGAAIALLEQEAQLRGVGVPALAEMILAKHHEAQRLALQDDAKRMTLKWKLKSLANAHGVSGQAGA